MGFLLLVTLSSLLSGFICFYIARRRRANHVFWSAMGIAFGPLAIPFTFFARPLVGN